MLDSNFLQPLQGSNFLSIQCVRDSSREKPDLYPINTHPHKGNVLSTV